MTISEMIEVLQHAQECGAVERLIKSSHKPKWDYVEAPTWDFNACDYRIKPERVALNQQDLIERELSGKTMYVRQIRSDVNRQISTFDKYGITLNGAVLMYDAMVNNYEWLDGTPCSKECE